MKKLFILDLTEWFFGFVLLAIGVLNIFWGNDPEFGIFVALCSLVYFPPMNDLFSRNTTYYIPKVFKIILGVLIVWAALGVGELTGKIDLLMNSL